MPRELAELRLFNIGTVLSTDSSDIAMEAASFSINLDIGTENGVLKGVPVDEEISFSDLNGQVVRGDVLAPMDYIAIDGNEHLVIRDSAGWHITSTFVRPPGG